MNKTRRLLSACVAPLVTGALLIAQTPAVASAQITAGYVNNFEDGTTQGWSINLLGGGNGLPANVLPTNVASGGPAGASDNYLRLTSIGGAGAGSRLVAISPFSWGGNYLAAGITEIRFDAINLGQSDIALRFLLEDPNMAPPTNIAASAVAATLLAGGGWQTVVFPLFGPGGLAPIAGTVEGALTNATIARIYHSSALAFPGDASVAVLGIDNIRAVGAIVSVPEPSSAVMLPLAVLMFALARSRTVRRANG